MKAQGFVLTARLAVAVLLMLCMVGGAAWAGVGWIRDFQSDALRDECNQLDYAVRRYGQSHLAVDTGSEHFDEKDTFRYSMVQTYPESQDKLLELHTLGYLVKEVDLSNFQWRAGASGAYQDTSVTFYTVSDDRTKYRIEVTLPNGKSYVTPGSSSF